MQTRELARNSEASSYSEGVAAGLFVGLGLLAIGCALDRRARNTVLTALGTVAGVGLALAKKSEGTHGSTAP